MVRPRSVDRIGALVLCAGLLAVPPRALAQNQQHLPPIDSLPPGVSMEMVEAGRAIFHGDGLCVTCHGSEAAGDIGPDLTDGEWIQEKGSYLSILEVILDGVPAAASTTGTAMPPRGDSDISDLEVQSVAAYVWKTSHPEAADSLPSRVTEGMVTRGEQIFLGEGGCALCHGTDATGLLGPDLTDDEWLDAKGSYLTIGRIVARGIPAALSTRGIEMPPRGGSDISPQEIEQVAAYVWYMSHRDR